MTDVLTDCAPPRVCFALPVLFTAVVVRFALEGTCVDQHFGWREPQRYKTERARIVWVPGDDGGNVGEVRPARNPGTGPNGGTGPRSLATIGELFTCHISANDPNSPEVEIDQYIAARALFDAWYRAVYLAAHGTFAVLSLAWNTTKNERRHGAELVCVCWIEAKVPDAPYVLVPVDSKVEVETSLDDVTETTTTASA